jgi:hypothetical protein
MHVVSANAEISNELNYADVTRDPDRRSDAASSHARLIARPDAAIRNRRSDWMNLTNLPTRFVATAAMLVLAVPASAQDGYLNNQSQQLDFNLFQNFYTPQGPSLSTAAMYNAPHPVPYWVGSSMYTYQPFYPHEHLYQHTKNYYNYYGSADQFYSDNLQHGRGGDALNRTTVVYKGTGYHFGNFPFSSLAAQRLKYNIHAHKYGLRGTGAGDLGPAGYGLGHGHCRGGHCHGGHCRGGHGAGGHSQGCPNGTCQ